jgi:aspartyl-tRNA(Asn)/glutamyl-tRNA(Gln) amidotransferase subunit C
MSDDAIAAVRRVAELARLRMDESELATLGAQFTSILRHFEVLSRLNVDGVEPMTGASDLADVLREDRPTASLTPDEALANAPERVGDFYGVPKTVGGEE